MSRILGILAVVGTALMLLLPAPASAASRPDGIRKADATEFSAARRIYRRYYRHPYYRPYYWGPRPYYYGYPYPYYRPYYYYHPAPWPFWPWW